MKKLVGLLLAMLILLSAVGVAETPEYLNTESMMPFVKEGESATLTVGVVLGEKYCEPQDSWYWKWMEDVTGVDYEFVTIDASVKEEKLNLMLASGDIPDVMLRFDFNNLDIVKYGIEMEMLMPLNDLIEQYAPNLVALFEENPTLKAGVTAPDGNIYALGCWNEAVPGTEGTDNRAWIKQSWLDALGLERPETLDEMYDVLVAFRDRDPNGNGLKDEIPICETSARTGFLVYNALGIVTSFAGEGLSLTPALKDGKAIIPAASEYYRLYLETMNKWYTEGLIDPDCYTLTTAQQQAKAAENRIGVHVQSAPHTVQAEGYEDWQFYPALTSSVNDTPVWPISPSLTTGRIAVSAKCEEPELAARLINWLYSDEASVYGQWGPREGSEEETHGVHGWYFDENGNGPIHRREENDGYSSDLLYRCAEVAQIYNVGLMSPEKSILDLWGIEIAGRTGAAGHWRQSMWKYMSEALTDMFPKVFLTEEESAIVTEMITPLQDYVAMMEAKFVTGIESLDNFDSYMEHLYSLGLQEYTDIYTNAYAIYAANLG